MTTKTWTIFGAGNNINDINDAIESNYQKLKLIVLNMELDEETLNRIPRAIKIIDVKNFKPSTDCYFFGFVDPNKQPLLEILKKFKLTFPNLIHKFSYVAKTAEMGEGNFVGAGAVIAPNVKLGDFNFVNRSASIGHDTKVSSFNHFGPACTVAGRCKIGNKNLLGAGSTIIDGIEIKDEITIGAGGVITKNIWERGTYVGLPVKKIK